MANLSDKVSQGTIPAAELTKRTKWVDLTLSNTPAGWTNYSARGWAYADSDDNWTLDFSIKSVLTATTTAAQSCDIDGITSKNQTVSHPITSIPNSVETSTYGFILSNDNTITINHETADNAFIVWGSIELASKPDWADDNMENEIAVNAYIPEATSTDAGLLSSYEENSFTATLTASSSGTVDTTTCYYTKIGRVVTFTMAFFNVGTGHSGTLSVTGFPFTSPTDYMQMGSLFPERVVLSTTNAGENPFWRIESGSSEIKCLKRKPSDGRTYHIDGADILDSNADFLLSGSIQVDE